MHFYNLSFFSCISIFPDTWIFTFFLNRNIYKFSPSTLTIKLLVTSVSSQHLNFNYTLTNWQKNLLNANHEDEYIFNFLFSTILFFFFCEILTVISFYLLPATVECRCINIALPWRIIICFSWRFASRNIAK